MIELPKMLLIGALGKDVGKTTFMCDVLKKFGCHHKISAVKVTTVKRDWSNSDCFNKIPKLNTEPFKLFAGEKDSDNHGNINDTARFLKAGAERSWWLLVQNDKLEEGYSALMSKINEAEIIVCESNSFRRIVKPGLFLLIIDERSISVKSSAWETMDQADVIIRTDGSRFRPDVGNIQFTDKFWSFIE